MKTADIVIGLFVVGLYRLSYKECIDIKWIEMEDAIKTILKGKRRHALNNTAS
jgi:uncharacterized membrane protein (Fun14 family)